MLPVVSSLWTLLPAEATPLKTPHRSPSTVAAPHTATESCTTAHSTAPAGNLPTAPTPAVAPAAPAAAQHNTLGPQLQQQPGSAVPPSASPVAPPGSPPAGGTSSVKKAPGQQGMSGATACIPRLNAAAAAAKKPEKCDPGTVKSSRQAGSGEQQHQPEHPAANPATVPPAAAVTSPPPPPPPAAAAAAAAAAATPPPQPPAALAAAVVAAAPSVSPGTQLLCCEGLSPPAANHQPLPGPRALQPAARLEAAVTSPAAVRHALFASPEGQLAGTTTQDRSAAVEQGLASYYIKTEPAVLAPTQSPPAAPAAAAAAAAAGVPGLDLAGLEQQLQQHLADPSQVRWHVVLLRNLANRLYGRPVEPVQLSALLPQLPGQLQYLRERVTGNDQLHHKARLQPSTAAQHTACLLRVLALPEVQAQLESQQQLQELVQEVTQAQQQFEALCSSSAGAAPGGQQQGCAQPPALAGAEAAVCGGQLPAAAQAGGPAQSFCAEPTTTADMSAGTLASVGAMAHSHDQHGAAAGGSLLPVLQTASGVTLEQHEEAADAGQLWQHAVAAAEASEDAAATAPAAPAPAAARDVGPGTSSSRMQDAGQPLPQLLSENKLEPTLATEQFDSALPQLSPAACGQFLTTTAGGTTQATQAGTLPTSVVAAAAAAQEQAGSLFAAQAAAQHAGQDSAAMQPPSLSVADVCALIPHKYDTGCWLLRVWAKLVFGDAAKPDAIQLAELAPHWDVCEQYLEDRAAGRLARQEGLPKRTIRMYVRAIQRVFEEPAVLQQLHSCGLQHLTQRIAVTKARWAAAGGSGAKQHTAAAAAAATRQRRAAAADMWDDDTEASWDEDTSGSDSDSGSDSGSNGGDDAAAPALSLAELLPTVSRQAARLLDEWARLVFGDSYSPARAPVAKLMQQWEAFDQHLQQCAAGSSTSGAAQAASTLRSAQQMEQVFERPDVQQQLRPQDLRRLRQGLAASKERALSDSGPALEATGQEVDHAEPAKAEVTAHQLAKEAAAAPEEASAAAAAAGVQHGPDQAPFCLSALYKLSDQFERSATWLLRTWAKLVYGDTADSLPVSELLPHWDVMDAHMQQRVAGSIAGEGPLLRANAIAYMRTIQRVFEAPEVQQRLSSQEVEQINHHLLMTKARWSKRAQAALQHDQGMPRSTSMPSEAAAAAASAMPDSPPGSKAATNPFDAAAAAIPCGASTLLSGQPQLHPPPAETPFAAAAAAAGAANQAAVQPPSQQQQQHAAGTAVEGGVARAAQLPTADRSSDPRLQPPMTLAELISGTSNAQVVGQLRQWARLVYGQDVDAGSVRVSDLLQHWSVYDMYLQQKLAWGPDGSPPEVKQKTAQHYTYVLSRTFSHQRVQAQLSSQLQQQLAQQIEETKHRLRGRSCTVLQAGAAAV